MSKPAYAAGAPSANDAMKTSPEARGLIARRAEESAPFQAAANAAATAKK